MTSSILAKLFAISASLALAVFVLFTFIIGRGNTTNFYINTLWVNITFMGDAIFGFSIFICLFIFGKHKNISSKLLLSIICCLIIVQVLKNLSYGLPFQLFFESSNYIGKIKGEEKFISSHISIAFCMAFFVTHYTNKLKYKIILISTAFLVMISRFVIANASVSAAVFSILVGLISVFVIYKIAKRNTSKNVHYFKSKMNKQTDKDYFLWGT